MTDDTIVEGVLIGINGKPLTVRRLPARESHEVKAEYEKRCQKFIEQVKEEIRSSS